MAWPDYVQIPRSGSGVLCDVVGAKCVVGLYLRSCRLRRLLVDVEFGAKLIVSGESLPLEVKLMFRMRRWS